MNDSNNPNPGQYNLADDISYLVERTDVEARLLILEGFVARLLSQTGGLTDEMRAHAQLRLDREKCVQEILRRSADIDVSKASIILAEWKKIEASRSSA
jgi:hypothetical protein